HPSAGPAWPRRPPPARRPCADGMRAPAPAPAQSARRPAATGLSIQASRAAAGTQRWRRSVRSPGCRVMVQGSLDPLSFNRLVSGLTPAPPVATVTDGRETPRVRGEFALFNNTRAGLMIDNPVRAS